MNNYDDEQSEDGELAQSPIRDEMDFSLSDEEHDSLVIKPPQAIIQPSYRRSHKKIAKDRYKEVSHKEKKHLYRDRDKLEKAKMARNPEREDANKEFYREKPYYREAYKEKEAYREKEIYRERDVYKEKEIYREREHHREKEYREGASYKESGRTREAYREKDIYKEKELQRDREILAKDRQRYELERRQRGGDIEKIENRLRSLADDSISVEKENRDKGDKELEDLRSRLLNKRISKELQDAKKHSEYIKNKSDRNFILDKHQQERRKKLLEAEREMEKRKHESRNELEARRQERRRRGKKRSVSPDDEEMVNKRNKNESPELDDSYVTVSDASDIEIKSESAPSDQEEDQNSKSYSDESSGDSDSDVSKSDDDDEDKEEDKSDDYDKSEDDKSEDEIDIRSSRERSRSPVVIRALAQESPMPGTSPNSHSRSKSRSRSRSHSFSPPPAAENGKTVEEEVHNEEETKLLEEKIKNLPPYFPALQGCRSVEEFHCLNRIEEGTYGVVYRARDRTTEEIVALKRLKMEKEKEGFPITSLREINTLLKGQHPNIVTVREIVVGSNMDKIFIVMDYVEHDLKSLMETMRGKKQVFLPGEVKCLMRQLLSAVHHLHDNWILHRDLKTSNLLLSHKGILKVGDFGLAREYGSPLRQYTPIVVTLWYRAPELLLCSKQYSTHIDMWSVGCIFAEFVTMNPLFPGKSEVDQLNRIFKDLGTPSESVWPGYSQLPAVQKMTFAEQAAGGLRARAGPELSDAGLALLQAFLTYDPAKRIHADDAKEHAYFKEQPLAIDPAMFPTWPAKSEGRRATASPRAPAGGAAHNARADDDGFHVRSVNMAPGFSLKF